MESRFERPSIEIYSKRTSEVRTLKSRDEDAYTSVCYDAMNKKVYYSNYSDIHWINLDGSGDETLFSNREWLNYFKI